MMTLKSTDELIQRINMLITHHHYLLDDCGLQEMPLKEEIENLEEIKLYVLEHVSD